MPPNLHIYRRPSADIRREIEGTIHLPHAQFSANVHPDKRQLCKRVVSGLLARIMDKRRISNNYYSVG